MGEIKRFNLPDVGEGLTEAEILTWLVKVGDTITTNQFVVEIETAKAAVELPSPYAGEVVELLVQAGATVDVGTPIIGVDVDPSTPSVFPSATGSAATDALTSEAATTVQAKAAPVAEKREPVLVGYGVKPGTATRRTRKSEAPAANGRTTAGTAAAPAPTVRVAAVTVAAAATVPPGAKALAKPPVRKLAKDLGVELATVVASGPGGIVTRDDVQLAASGAGAVPAVGPGSAPAAAFVSGERRAAIRGVRKITAAAMVASAFTAPHVTEFLTVDVTATMKLTERLKALPDFDGVRVSPLLLVAKALLVAMARNPEINAKWDEPNGEIVYHDHVNLGIAAATPRGLMVPNVKSADMLSLVELGRALNNLTDVARQGRTSPADMSGGTTTITNVGVFGVDTGTPILNPGEASILAFGAVREQPAVHKGKIKVRKLTTLALSFDHRLVDGELGSKVLRDVGAVLADPLIALAWS